MLAKYTWFTVCMVYCVGFSYSFSYINETPFGFRQWKFLLSLYAYKQHTHKVSSKWAL